MIYPHLQGSFNIKDYPQVQEDYIADQESKQYEVKNDENTDERLLLCTFNFFYRMGRKSLSSP